MAGVPKEVIDRAKEILGNLEASELTPDEYPRIAVSKPSKKAARDSFQISLFEPVNAELIQKIKALDIDGMSPKEAIEFLYRLKEGVGE